MKEKVRKGENGTSGNELALSQEKKKKTFGKKCFINFSDNNTQYSQYP